MVAMANKTQPVCIYKSRLMYVLPKIAMIHVAKGKPIEYTMHFTSSLHVYGLPDM